MFQINQAVILKKVYSTYNKLKKKYRKHVIAMLYFQSLVKIIVRNIITQWDKNAKKVQF